MTGSRSGRGIRLVGWIALGALALATVALAGTVWLIRSGVQTASEAALQEQPGDPVLSLMAYVDAPQHTLRDRNRAVWALGQLGDARALSVLEKHFTGGDCDHAHGLCQRELGKAIRLCRGGSNVAAVLWR